MKNNILKTLLAALLAFTITYCNGENSTANDPVTATYTLSVSVTGYNATNFTMLNSDAQEVGVTGNGTFSFPTPISSGTSYSVTVKAQPSDAYCTVTSGSGTMSAALTVAVSCSKLGYSWSSALTVPGAVSSTNFNGVAHGGGKFVVVGDYHSTTEPAILTSSDATVSFAIVGNVNNINTNLKAITYGNSTFVAVGTADAIFYSTDGDTWSNTTSGGTGSPVFNDVIYDGSNFVAVGFNGTNGIVCKAAQATLTSWSCTANANLGTVQLNSIAYNGSNLYLAGGNGGGLFSSADASTWSTNLNNTDFQTNSEDVKVIRYLEGNFFISGYKILDSLICISSNGTSCSSKTTQKFNITSIESLSGYYVGASDKTGDYRTSYAGLITWTTGGNNGKGGATTTNDIAYGNNIVIAACTGGKIYKSE